MKLLAALLILLSLNAEAGIIKGRVVGKTTREPLVGANVALSGTTRGTVTNTAGEFHIDRVPAGVYSITVSLIGFQRESRGDIAVTEGRETELLIELQPIAIQTDPVVVTASRREQSLQDVPVSVSVMEAQTIALRNSVTLDEAIRYIPGVNMTEFQVNIRGSSGYSRGAGSRVLMLVDGIPLLTGDTGELNFESIPIGQVDRIEVVKGASSALYGSSALGGVINVLTKPILDEPHTRIRTYGGFYDSPSYSQWDWGGGTRFFDGQSVSHSFKPHERFGLLFHGSRIADDGYRQNDFRRRYNGYLKMKYDISSFDAVTTTFNILHQKRGSFLYWRDLNNALVPPPEQLGDRVSSTRFFVATQYAAAISPSFLLTARGQWFRNSWDDTIDTLSNFSRSHVVRGEVQGTWTASEDHIITAGVDASLDRVNADLFGVRKGNSAAVYAQDEWQVVEWLKLTLGARFDHHDLDSLESTNQFNPKAGVVFTPLEGTAIRASYGRGFRAPASAEAFITAQAGGIDVIPNPALKPERSSAIEVGVSQFLGDVALVDLALFHSDYTDLIEPRFVPIGGVLKGQFNNVTRARVQGVELLTRFGFLDKALLMDIGYTYLYPRDRTENAILKFRPRHLLYANAMARPGIFTVATDFRYISRVERIDQEFEIFVADAGERVDIVVVDVRLGADFRGIGVPLSATLSVNNLFQYNYVELIANLAPPRSFVLTLEANL
jgi:outer membrane receptor for ferrienterochelin and colicins